MATSDIVTDRSVVGPIVHSAADFQGMEAGEALDKFDLVKLAADGTLEKTDAGTDAAIGIVDRAYADGSKECSVLKLDGRVLKMRASGAIAVGAYVMAAADGEIATWAATTATDNAADPRQLGIAMTAASLADDVIDVLTGV